MEQSQPLTFADLLSLVEKINFVVYYVLRHDLGMKLAPSFSSPMLQENGANLLMASLF